MARLCSYYGCKELALPDTHRCASHPPREPRKKVRKDWEKYNNRHIYQSSRWQRLREQQLILQPLCEHCLLIDIVREANTVDHIVEVRDGGDIWDIENLQSLCPACHNRKTAEERKKREKKKRLGDFRSMNDF